MVCIFRDEENFIEWHLLTFPRKCYSIKVVEIGICLFMLLFFSPTSEMTNDLSSFVLFHEGYKMEFNSEHGEFHIANAV